MATELFRHKDKSGHIEIAVFTDSPTTLEQAFHGHPIEVAEDMVAVGGGAVGANEPGAYLTASFPNEDRTAWLVSSKDHYYPNPHILEGFAIGLKINGFSREQLLKPWTLPNGQNHPALVIFSTSTTPSSTSSPTASVATPVETYTLISGGFRVNWKGKGSLATASFPEFGDEWTARSKDHIEPDRCTIDTWAVSMFNVLPLQIPVPSPPQNPPKPPPPPKISSAARVVRRVRSDLSGRSSFPSSRAAFTEKEEVALTGVGAEVRYEGAGSLLWQLQPIRETWDEGVVIGARASAKDHKIESRATIKTWAIGVELAPEPPFVVSR